MSAPPGMPAYVSPSGSTAKTLILIGLILGIIEALVSVFLIGVGGLIAASFGGFSYGVGFAIFGLIGGIIGFVILYLVYTLCYKRVQNRQYEQARLPTLIFAILSLVTFNIIAGILYLIAWIKLGDAVREAQMPPPGYAPMGQPMMGAPVPMAPAAPMAAAPAAAPAPICPTCGKPATWIPQYNRYYCYTDSKYV